MPNEATIWSEDKTVKQNYQAMGLVQNVKPSMRQTNQGKELLSKARVRLNQAYYANQGMNVDYAAEIAELEQKTKEEFKEKPADLTTVFPELKTSSKNNMKPTVRKLKNDEK